MMPRSLVSPVLMGLFYLSSGEIASISDVKNALKKKENKKKAGRLLVENVT